MNGALLQSGIPALRPGAEAAPADAFTGTREEDGLRSHSLGPLLVRTSAIRRALLRCIAGACRLEGGQHFSRTARTIMKMRCGVEIGAYSYGPCFEPGVFPSGVRVGRYVSIAQGVCVLLRNHPMDRLSMHPLFFNPLFGTVPRDDVEWGTLEIGGDAWIGANAIVTPRCSRIGVGAVVGAGAVVTRDVPDFAIVAGNPAKVIRFRFDEETRGAVLRSGWWELPLGECRRVLGAMGRPLSGGGFEHPLLDRHIGRSGGLLVQEAPCG